MQPSPAVDIVPGSQTVMKRLASCAQCALRLDLESLFRKCVEFNLWDQTSQARSAEFRPKALGPKLNVGPIKAKTSHGGRFLGYNKSEGILQSAAPFVPRWLYVR